MAFDIPIYWNGYDGPVILQTIGAFLGLDGPTGPRIMAATGDPNGAVFAPVGSVCAQKDSAALWINTDGGSTWTLVLSNPIAAILRLRDGGVAWDDLKLPFTATRQGALGKPDFDETEVEFLFPQNDASEKLLGIAQMPHAWKIGTDIHLHIHWRQEAATAVTWKADYKLCPIAGPEPAGWTTLSGNAGLIPYAGVPIHQLTEIGSIDMSAVTGVSAIVRLRVYRDDNVTAGDVAAWEADFHYQIDSFGSDQEYLKS